MANGNGRTVMAYIGMAIIIGSLIASLAVTVTSKADKIALQKASERLTTVEAQTKGMDEKIDRIDNRVEKIYDMLLKDGK